MSKLIQGSLKIKPNVLNLKLTLTSGQNFRWRKSRDDDNEWLGVIDNRYVVSLKQTDKSIDYKVLNSDSIDQQKNPKKAFESCLEHYFRLDCDLESLYSTWFTNDIHFHKTSIKFQGIRLLRQSLPENIFSFICSSNNNVPRITTMVEALCSNYGSVLFQGNHHQCDAFYSFPCLSALSDTAVESKLRELSFGYRAKFIQQSARKIVSESEDNTGEDWMQKLSILSYEDAKQMLMSLPGIGAKVADCICLMSLEHTQAIPIDTHILKLTLKYYLPHLKESKSLTTNKYNQIADFYREKFKIHAGWGQTVLFCIDLLKLKN